MPSVGVIHVLDSTSNKPRPLTLASNVLSVNDSNARSSLASLDGKMTTNNSSLTSINSALGSTLTVSDGTAQSTLSAIDSKLGGTIATSTSLAVTKGDTTVSNAASVVNGDLSSSHDARANRKLGIFGTTTDTSNNIEIHVSQDNSTYYKYGHTDIFPASDGSFSAFLEAPFKYVKLKYLGNATVTAIIAGVD